MPTGILIIDKPQGWTSMDVCAKLRGMYHERGVGHGGTLDPMATGVLPVFLGRATRAVEFCANADKEYAFELQLGVITNTQDASGEVLETRPVQVSQADLEAVLPRFRGPIAQIPPMYSAIKRDGKKLYELARKGKEVDRPPRHIEIRSLEITERLAPDQYRLQVHCSKGTYVRTLCHDIGQALGCGGMMAALRRTMAGSFTLKNAVSLEQVQAAVDRGEALSLLRPVDRLFKDRPALMVPPSLEQRVRCGAAVPVQGAPDGEYRLYSEKRAFLALVQVSNGTAVTVKNFFEVK